MDEMDYLLRSKLERRVIALEADSPLEIRLVSPPKVKPTLADRLLTMCLALWRDRLLLSLFVAAVAMFAVTWVLWAYYVRFQRVGEVQQGQDGLDFAVRYSPWLVVGDEESFTVTMVNNGNVPLTEVKAYLVFTGNLPVCTTVDGSNCAEFDQLAVNERKTRTIKLLLDGRTARGAQAELKVVSKESGEISLGSYDFNIPRIPYLKSSLRRVVSSLNLALLPLLGWLLRGTLKGALPEG
jgi:hypothetical protein